MSPLNRRDFLKLSALAAAPALMAQSAVADVSVNPVSRSGFKIKPFEFSEITISDLQKAMERGHETAVSIAGKYLKRIEETNHRGPNLGAVIEINPDALSLARNLDRERKAKGTRGPLHGIPVLIKDNIDTHDKMMTTAGSLALLGSIAPRDSFVAQKLREAGAVILGKTNLSEWANFRGEHSTSGWSGRGGVTKNPYVLDRNPSGSSSGSACAVSANLCAVAIGTETDGSIVSPSSACGIVGLKPTVGLISRSGIIPISRSQDTAGPMARTVRDAAILLGVLTGVDPRDSATQVTRDPLPGDYTKFLDADGLRGVRLGVAVEFFRHTHKAAPGFTQALEEMKRLGATLFEFKDRLGHSEESDAGDSEGEVLHYEFKAGINEYLASLGPDAPMRTLEDLITFNEKHKESELQYFGQEEFLASQSKGPLTDKAYVDAVEKCRRSYRDAGIDAIMGKYQLDAIIAPAGGPAGVTDLLYGDRDIGGSSSPAAVAGYPNITVPAGQVLGLPIGLSFFGRAYSEPTLLKIAYAFERGTKARFAPGFLPTLG
jgi:amidase